MKEEGPAQGQVGGFGVPLVVNLEISPLPTMDQGGREVRGWRSCPAGGEGWLAVLGTRKGARREGPVRFLRPSQDAPDASVGSVCVQGDQDTKWTGGVSLLAGPGGGTGSRGDHSGNQGCLWHCTESPRSCSPALLPSGGWTPRGASNGCGHVTLMYTDRFGGR